MGTEMAPSYANLVLGKFEHDALINSPYQPHIWLRFIDDIFMIWTILVPRATRLLLNYVSCSSGNGQKFIIFDWLIQTVCAIALKCFGFYA